VNGARRPPAGGDPALVRRTALRLGLQAATATLVVLTLMIVVLGVLLARSTAAADDTRLTVTAGNADDVTDPPSGMWIVLREHGTITASPGLPTGLPLTAALDRAAAHAPPEDTTITLNGHDYRLRTQARSHPEAAQVQIVLDEAPAQQQQATLLRALCAAALLGLLLTAAVGVGLGRRAVRPLETALAIQRRFVADAGHELRTPLTLLSTRAQLLRRNLPHHTTAAHTTAAHTLAPEIDAVVADARRLATILDDLLLAADPRPPTEHTIIDLTTVMTSALDAARPGATEKGVTLTRTPTPARTPARTPTAAPPAPTPVRGSAAGLHRAITAVLDNAIRHAATHVTATVHTHGRHTTIEIADDGPGIDPTLLPHVFERFATTNPEQPDTTRRYGIGLALVTDIIARHGGTVHARNRPEGGAAFTLNLPRVSKRTPKITRHPRH
jgi:two-component system, OmpR family, sensor kinase